MREALERHWRICDDLYRLALEENEFLRRERRPPDESLLGRKRALLDQLTASLDSLKQGLNPSPGAAHEETELRERVREKILQVVHLDRENEKLLLKVSLPGRAAAAVPPPPPPPGAVARAYGQALPPSH